MTQHINISGKSYPFKFSFGAQQRLMSRGIDLTQAMDMVGKNDFNFFIQCIYEGVKSGCIIEKIECPFNEDDFIEYININDFEAYMKALTNDLPKVEESPNVKAATKAAPKKRK
jgi:hypothetical protein